MDFRPKAVVLLSGGIDSATVLAIAQQHYQVSAMTFRYGQRHAVEVDLARQLARQRGVLEHRVVDIDLRAFGKSALTDTLAVPKDRDLAAMTSGIPATYVPARNTIFLSYSLAWAEVLDAADIFIGVNSLDRAGYPDCRSEYIEAFQRMANLATRMGVEGHKRITIHTPLIRLTKSEIIATGLSHGVDYGLTSSCYDPSPLGEACGRCDACVLRLDGFASLGVSDPRPYRSSAQVPT